MYTDKHPEFIMWSARSTIVDGCKVNTKNVIKQNRVSSR